MRLLTFVIAFALLASVVIADEKDQKINEYANMVETEYLKTHDVVNSEIAVANILEKEPKEYVTLYTMSKILYIKAEISRKQEEQVKLYEKGIEMGKKAVEVKPESEAAKYWYYMNMKKRSWLKRDTGAIGDVKRGLENLIKDNPEYIPGIQAYAALLSELPGLFGGNIEKALELLLNAVQLDPGYSALYMDIAKVYVKTGDYKKAREYLNQAIQIEKPTDKSSDTLYEKASAIKLLEEIKNK